MVGSKGDKSNALDTFWDTVSTPSSNVGSMSDLLSSIPSASRKAAIKSAEDPILVLLKALLPAPNHELTVVDIGKKTDFAPLQILEVTKQAVSLGLVESDAADPAKVRYRLTKDGVEFARSVKA